MRRSVALIALALSPAALAFRPPPEAPPSLVERFDGVQADLEAIKGLLGALKGKPPLLAEARSRLERALAELEGLENDTRGTAAPPPPPPPPLAFMNASSGLCLGVVGNDRHRAGDGVELAPCLGERGQRPIDQQWNVVPAGDGLSTVRNQATGLCLGVRGVDRATVGAEAEVYDCGAAPGDPRLDNQWKVVDTERGVQVRNRVTGLCLSVRDGDRHGPGAVAVLDECDAPRRGRDSTWGTAPYASLVPVIVERVIERAPPVRPEPPPPPRPIAQAELDKVLKTVDSQSFGEDKLRVLKLALAGKPVSVAQVKAVIGEFSFSSEKLEVVRMLNPTIVDRENRFQLLELFTFDSEKRELEGIISQ